MIQVRTHWHTVYCKAVDFSWLLAVPFWSQTSYSSFLFQFQAHALSCWTETSESKSEGRLKKRHGTGDRITRMWQLVPDKFVVHMYIVLVMACCFIFECGASRRMNEVKFESRSTHSLKMGVFKSCPFFFLCTRCNSGSTFPSKLTQGSYKRKFNMEDTFWGLIFKIFLDLSILSIIDFSHT